MNAQERATAQQNRASDPRRSTWVSANAGSGKTRVLTDRVARLLLSGVDARKILCLTFTKAAAAEMQSRLFRRLGEWAMMGDDVLRAQLSEIGEAGSALDAERLAHARTLFAQALETPGGLKIQTIHAFSAQLLRRFPLEAGVSPQFEEIDDADAAALVLQTLDEMAEARPDALLPIAGKVANEAALVKIAEKVRGHATEFAAFDANVLAATLGISPDATEEAINRAALDDIGREVLVGLARTIERFGTKQPIGYVAPLLELSGKASDAEVMVAAEKSLLTAKSVPRDLARFPGNPVTNAAPEIADTLAAIMDRIRRALEDKHALRVLERSRDLAAFAHAFVPAYEAKKAARAALDFDDFIERAAHLLRDANMARWVHYKLDGGIDHILVDESQDTSPRQWEIIRVLESEFTDTGDGDGRARTLFVVGDKKQSIFSFQGADPEGFSVMRDRFADRLEAIGKELAQVELPHSFRSAGPILQLVDRIFDNPGIGAIGEAARHAYFENKPGRVDLWDFLSVEKSVDETRWCDPVDRISPEAAVPQLARKVADFVRAQLADGVAIPDKEKGWRAAEPKDFLILVRSRSVFFHHVIAALKARGIPVAGADRLKLGKVLAVRDVMSLLRFVDNDLDDLALAEALRSPLFGLSERDLFNLANDRTGTLWEALRGAAGFAEHVRFIERLRNAADFERPFELIETILTEFGGRRRLATRLGAETDDGLDELLTQALAFEMARKPTLTNFIARMQESEIEVKRQHDDAANEVRIMTVHGAKGLEAPVVVVPDVTKQGARPSGINLQPVGDTVVWVHGDKATLPEVLRSANEDEATRDREESERLLYVALTRAEHRLVICGAGDENQRPWYRLVSAAMDGLDTTPLEGAETGRSFANTYWADQTLPTPHADAVSPQAPDWLAEVPAPYRRLPATVSPSELAEPHALPGEAALDAEDAKARGRAVHRLLEVLPDVTQSERGAVGARLLADRDDSDELIAIVERMLAAPGLAPVFAPDTIREAPVTAYLDPLGRSISGRIDALMLGPDLVHAVDFKSNRVVPGHAEEVPFGILAQMGAYDAALRLIWPERKVRVSILWTETADLMALPHELVSDALARVSAP